MGDILPTVPEYDFIVCGGGTSGCVVAGRLAEDPNVSVLVIEAGKHNENLEAVNSPGGWRQLPGSDLDWNIKSEPSASVNGRTINLTRGKVLGGSSGANATLCVRGTRQDYDDWNMPGWSGEEMFGYINKAENFQTKPWFEPGQGAHGTEGPLYTEPLKLFPISERIMDSMESKGIPRDQDMFAHGRNPQGCGHATRTTRNGRRTSSADFVTGAMARSNLTLMTETLVDKVLFSKGNPPRAEQVQAVKSDGTKLKVKARREIIISGGSYCSPNILNRSGIGARAELEKHGIPVLVDLPGVGHNLMDHAVVYMFYEVNQPGLTRDSLLFHGNAIQETRKRYIEERTGPLASFPFGSFGYSRLDSRLKDSSLWNSSHREPGRDPMGLSPTQPNIEFFTTECYCGPLQWTRFPTGGEHSFAVVVQLFYAQSRGNVALCSAEATDKPVVSCSFLDNPLDLEVLAEGCAFGNEIIMEGAGTKDIVKGAWPPEEAHHRLKTRAEWKDYVKSNLDSCFHPAGTCAMGKASDPQSVLDEALRVRGVEGLRVVDCSVMPSLICGHPQMAAYGIGEKAADLIKATHSLK